MPGTIRTLLGLTLLFCAGSVDDTLPDAEFFGITLALAIPGAVLGFWGATALNQAERG